MKNFDAENWLETSGRKSPYKVPEGYFEAFREKMGVMARDASSAGRDTNPAPVSVRTLLRPVFAMAASFVLLVALGGLLLKSVTPVQAELEDVTLYSYYCDIIPRSDAEAIYFSRMQDNAPDEEAIAAFLDESGINLEEYDTYPEEPVR